jgi:oligopeptidase B
MDRQPPRSTPRSHEDWRWLRDLNNPKTLAFLRAENARVEGFMSRLRPLEDTLYEEMKGRIRETDCSVPARYGAFEYFTRTEKGKQYPILCRTSGQQGGERTILDCNALAEGHGYFALAFARVRPDGELLAYATDTSGDEVYVLRFKDLRTGAPLPEEIPDVYYSAAWDNGGFFYYTTLDAAKRPHRLWRHEAGSAAPDVLIYEEPDERFNVSIERSRSGDFLFMTIESHTTTEVRIGPDFRPLATRVQGIEYYAEHQGEWIYIRTNDGAKNFRLMRLPAADPTREWEEVIPARPDIAIEEIAGFRDHLVLIERDRGLRRAVVDGRPVDFGELVTVFLDTNEEYDTTFVRLACTSLKMPRSVYDVDMTTLRTELRKRDEIAGYDPANYIAERIFAGRVPISLVYRKEPGGAGRDGSNPLLLYGYGAYGITTDPSFSSDRISLLDRGWIYAIAHIRGSGDLGREWYEEGKLLHKKNSFADFIACAELLIAEKYTSAAKLAIMGRSAGGLLMGAVTNMRPDLFKTVVAGVPFVDCLNTMLDASLPLTVTEYEEWGNPNDPAFYEYIRSYAPFENVERKAYPNILVTAGLNDPRVPYWEPAKWVARLREMKTDDNTLLLKTEMEAGHGGRSGRYEKLRERAFEYAFLIDAIAAPG